MVLTTIALVLSVGGSSVENGIASYYHESQKIACGGGQFNPNGMTAAHKSLPCGSQVRVTNKVNGKSVVLTINDRGPFIPGRIIDVSYAAASSLGMIGSGTAPVTVEIISSGRRHEKLSKRLDTAKVNN